jgi:hypothetical protein
MRKIFVIILIIGFSGSAFAEVYSWTDEKGVKHYSTVTPSKDAVNVMQSDEIQYDAEEDAARAQEYKQWMNQKQQEQKINSLKMKKRTKVQISDENQSDAKADEALTDEYKNQQKSEQKVIIYVDKHKNSHKHIKNLKKEEAPKARREVKKAIVKPQKAPPAASSEKDKIKIPKKQ